jgi:putative restriction endonuclease
MTEMLIGDYCRQFAKLKRAPNRIFPETTRYKTPHKLLLLRVSRLHSEPF